MGIERFSVGGVGGVLDGDHPPRREEGAVPGVPGGQDAVEHVVAPGYRLHKIQWSSHTHEVARFALRHVRRGEGGHVPEHGLLLAHRKAPGGVAGQIQFAQILGREAAQRPGHTALHDSEESRTLSPLSVSAPPCPPGGSGGCGLHLPFAGSARNKFVEGHGDVHPEVLLNGHGPLGAQKHLRAVHWRAECDTVFVHLSQPCQGKHLKAAGIGQDRSRPRHEAMKPAQVADPGAARPQGQMEGIGQHEGRAGLL